MRLLQPLLDLPKKCLLHLRRCIVYILPLQLQSKPRILQTSSTRVMESKLHLATPQKYDDRMNRTAISMQKVEQQVKQTRTQRPTVVAEAVAVEEDGEEVEAEEPKMDRMLFLNRRVTSIQNHRTGWQSLPMRIHLLVQFRVRILMEKVEEEVEEDVELEGHPQPSDIVNLKHQT